MRKFFTIVLIALSTVLWTGVADAQVRIRPLPGAAAPKVLKAPRAARVKPVKPNVMLIPPSVALKRAMRLAPNSKALDVSLRGPLYIVKLKQGGTITQIGVNSATGAIIRIP